MEAGYDAGSGARPGVPRSRGVLADAARALAETVSELLSPTRCAGCERPGDLVCRACLERLSLIDPRESCTRCGAPFGRMLCTECRGGPVAQDRCLATAAFEGPLPRIIRAYKDGGERRLATPMAEMLFDTALNAERMAPDRYGGVLASADLVTFVPVTAAAYRRRGFDHMGLVARHLCDLSGRPLADVLVKRGSSDQRKLGRASRMAGSRGLYEVVAPVEGARVLLLDDVITTGATVDASASALKAAGARCVDVLALARVW